MKTTIMILSVLSVASVLCSGCRSGQIIRVDNRGTLNLTQRIDSSPVTNSKETPFDLFRGLGQGSAVSAAPAATTTQSGSPTQDNASAPKSK